MIWTSSAWIHLGLESIPLQQGSLTIWHYKFTSCGFQKKKKNSLPLLLQLQINRFTYLFIYSLHRFIFYCKIFCCMLSVFQNLIKIRDPILNFFQIHREQSLPKLKLNPQRSLWPKRLTSSETHMQAREMRSAMGIL